jgi:hypothetical protein
LGRGSSASVAISPIARSTAVSASSATCLIAPAKTVPEPPLSEVARTGCTSPEPQPDGSILSCLPQHFVSIVLTTYSPARSCPANWVAETLTLSP